MRTRPPLLTITIEAHGVFFHGYIGAMGGQRWQAKPRLPYVWRGVVLATVLAAALLVAGSQNSTQPVHATETSGIVPPDIIDRYLAVRPHLGPVTVVDISGESSQRKLLAATLQGVVNRTSARIYLVGARQVAQDNFWLNYYSDQGLITVVAHDTLDQALATFAHEASGYVVASNDEPWTINTASSVAAAKGGVVVTPDLVALVTAVGLTQIDNHVGRWTNAADAYEATATATRTELSYQGLAIQQPDQHNPRDFFIQQGIMTVYTRPSDSDYDQIMDLLSHYPTQHPVYGYVADDGNEEVQAILRLSQHGRFLVPTDTTDNLSFHIAVSATTPRTALRATDGTVRSCDASDVNVVVATSDGDNMVIPEAYLPMGNRWASPKRGTLPIGWGISPAAAVLMPAIWDYYASTAGPSDEIVGLVGLGYNAPSFMPDPSQFLLDTNRLNATLGVDTVWSLDLMLGSKSAKGWDDIAQANDASGWKPSGYLLNYVDYGGLPLFWAAGMDVLTARSTDYSAGAAAIATHIDELLATPPDQRPLVNFFASTVWNATYDDLVASLAPYQTKGVRFLTPRQAFACLTDPTDTVPESTSTVAASSSTTPRRTVSTSTMHQAIGGGAVNQNRPARSAVEAAPIGANPNYVG